MKNENLITGAVVYKKTGNEINWYLVKKTQDSDWELPKDVVHKSESSVKAVLRMIGEVGGMRAVVLEEAGQTTVVTTKNGREVRNRVIFYLMQQKTGSIESGFYDALWLKYKDASRKIALAREKRILRQAKEVLSQWQKEHPTE